MRARVFFILIRLKRIDPAPFVWRRVSLMIFVSCRGLTWIVFCTTVISHNMAHYDEIRRKSVVNSYLRPRKANKINGLLVQGFHRREFSIIFARLLFSPVFNLMYLAVKPLWALTFLVFSCCDACCFCRTICRSAGTTFVLAVNPLSYICRICCRSTTNMKKLLLRLCRKSSFTWEIVLKRIWIFPDCYRLL